MKILALLIGVFLLLTPTPLVHAQLNGGSTGQSVTPLLPFTPCTNCNLTYTPLEPLYGLPTDTGSSNYLGSYIQIIFRISVTVAGLFAVGSIVFGGVAFVVSDVADTKKQARERVTAAFIGLGIVLGSIVLLNTINPNLVSLNTVFNPTTGLPGGGRAIPNTLSTGGTPTAAQMNQCMSQASPGVTCRAAADGTCTCAS